LHFDDFKEKGEHSLQELLHPLAGFFVPIFFVRMGYMVDLSSFGQAGILAFAGALTLAAIIGKQLCSLGIIERGLDRLSVGIGMIPRGEVGLIFAGIGMALFLSGKQVVSDSTYSAVLIMVIVTTLITPPALKWSLNRPRGYEGASDDEMARIAAVRRERRKEYFRSRTRPDQRGDHRSELRGEPSPEKRAERRTEAHGEQRSDRRLGRRRDGARDRRPQQGEAEAAAGRPERRDTQEMREGAPMGSEQDRGANRRRRRPRRRGGGQGGSPRGGQGGAPRGGSGGTPRGSSGGSSRGGPGGSGSGGSGGGRRGGSGAGGGGGSGGGGGGGIGGGRPPGSEAGTLSYSDST